MVYLKNAIVTGLTAVYLGLTSSPAFGQDTVSKPKSTTLADKVTCASLSPKESMEKNLTCFKDLAEKIQRYDGWRSPCSSEEYGPKDGQLGSFEYAKSLIMEYLLFKSDCDAVREGKTLPSSLVAYLVMGTIKDNFIPADVNGDCYLSPADDVNKDGMITLEDLQAYRTAATSFNPKIKCDYEKTENKK